MQPDIIQKAEEELQKIPPALSSYLSTDRTPVYASRWLWCEKILRPDGKWLVHVYKQRELAGRLAHFYKSKLSNSKATGFAAKTLERRVVYLGSIASRAAEVWRSMPWPDVKPAIESSMLSNGLDVLAPIYDYDPLPDSWWIFFRSRTDDLPVEKVRTVCKAVEKTVDERYRKQWDKVADKYWELMELLHQEDPIEMTPVMELLGGLSGGLIGLAESSKSR